MAPPFWHYFGLLLLFISWVFLLVASVTSPVFTDVALATVTLTNKTDIRHSSINFGSFGYCVLDVPPVTTDQDWCSSRHVGYAPVDIMSTVDGHSFGVSHPSTTNHLTDAFVLHPVAAAVAFIAFVVAAIPIWFASLLGAITAALAFIISLVVMAVDLAVFIAIKNAVNSDGSGSSMKLAVGMWLVVAATICLFLGSIIVFFSCCAIRNRNRYK